MAWNPSPKVAHARSFGKAFDCPQVIVLFVQRDGRLGYASYGERKKLCDETRKLADAAFDAALAYMEAQTHEP